MTRIEKSWVIYDVANSAFGLVVVTAIMPIFFKDVAAHGVAREVSTAWWGYGNSLSSVILLFLSPALGALGDNRGWKKSLFAILLAIGLLATAMLYFVGKGDWLFCLAIFITARTGWAGANTMYDSFLTDVADKRRMDTLSAAGFAWGYIGSVIPFLIVIALVFSFHGGKDYAIPPGAAQLGFLVVAAWWMLFSVPLLLNVHQVHFCQPAPHPVRNGFRRILKTLAKLREHRDAFLFLLSYFCIIDGVDTIISMSVAYGVDIGLGTVTMITAILAIQVIAFPCSLFWGRLSERFRPKRLLQIGLGMYCLITILAFIMPSLRTLQEKTVLFWLLSILVATTMGGIQALSRSFFGKLIPAERSAEFFGFYSISGKFATITGPFLFGVTGQLAGNSRYGVLSLLLLFMVGGVVLSRVREA